MFIYITFTNRYLLTHNYHYRIVIHTMNEYHNRFYDDSFSRISEIETEIDLENDNRGETVR